METASIKIGIIPSDLHYLILSKATVEIEGGQKEILAVQITSNRLS